MQEDELGEYSEYEDESSSEGSNLNDSLNRESDASENNDNLAGNSPEPVESPRENIESPPSDSSCAHLITSPVHKFPSPVSLVNI